MPTLLDRGKLVGEGLEGYIPIEYIIEWFRQRITKTGKANRVLVLKSETASGKSTVLPAFLYNARLAGETTRGMIVTQPRVITAIENVNEIKLWNKQYTSRDIGHSTKYDKMRPSRRGILSATIGTLTTELSSSSDEQFLARYQYIIIDEAHERSIQLDLTLMALNNFLNRCGDRPDCPFVVLASATIDPEVFLRFFGVPETNFIWCRGAPQPIDEQWGYMGDHTSTNYIKTAADIVAKITESDDSSKDSDILIFVPGAPETKLLRDLLEKLRIGVVRKDVNAAFDIIALERTVVNKYGADRQRLTMPLSEIKVTVHGVAYSPRRRVILATNVAETGLTLHGLKYVIDSGFAREVEYIPTVNASGLLTRPAPQSRVWQRRGRAGRNAPGVFYPTYPKHIYDKLPVQQLPDIITNSCIDGVIMALIAEQFRGHDDPTTTPIDITSVQLVEYPMAESISAAFHVLSECGFVKSQNGKDVYLTQLGKIAMRLSEIPLDHVRAIIAGYYWDIQPYDLIVGSAYVQKYTMKMNKVNWCAVYAAAGVTDGNPADCFRLRLLIGDSMVDGIVLYKALRAVGETGQSISLWCAENGIDYGAVGPFSELIDNMVEMFILARMRVFTDVKPILDDLTPDTISRFKHCVYDGFSHNLIVPDTAPRKYRQVGWSRRQVQIPPVLAENGAHIAANEAFGVKLVSLPKRVVCYRFNVSSDENTGSIAITAPHISVMDSFVA